MAVTLTLAELRNGLRTEESTEEDQILNRLLSVGTALVERAAPAAPAAIQNEATVRVAAYLFDQPPSARSNGTANALRNSGAAGLLLPFRVHRAGSTGPAAGGGAGVTVPDGVPLTGGLDAAHVQALIAAAGHVDSSTVSALISAAGHITAQQAQELIDASSSDPAEAVDDAAVLVAQGVVNIPRRTSLSDDGVGRWGTEVLTTENLPDLPGTGYHFLVTASTDGGTASTPYRVSVKQWYELAASLSGLSRVPDVLGNNQIILHDAFGDGDHCYIGRTQGNEVLVGVSSLSLSPVTLDVQLEDHIEVQAPAGAGQTVGDGGIGFNQIIDVRVDLLTSQRNEWFYLSPTITSSFGALIVPDDAWWLIRYRAFDSTGSDVAFDSEYQWLHSTDIPTTIFSGGFTAGTTATTGQGFYPISGNTSFRLLKDGTTDRLLFASSSANPIEVDVWEVTALVDSAGLLPWAQVGNTGVIPSDKSGLNGVQPWALAGGVDIPYSAIDTLLESWAVVLDQAARDAGSVPEHVPDERLPIARLLPGPTGLADGQVATIAGGAWTAADAAAAEQANDHLVLHEDVRLPAPARAMRIGWNQSRAITAAVFTRANQHPMDGAVQGTTPGLDVPPAPPAIDTDPTLYLAVWIEGDGDDGTVIRFGADDVTADFGMPMALAVNGGAGHYHVTRERLTHDTSRRLSVQIPGDMILGESDVSAWALADNADTIPADKLPPAPSGGDGGGLTITELANITTNSTSGSDRVFTASAAEAIAIRDARNAGTYKALKCRIGVDSGSGVHVHHDSPDILMNETSFGGGFQLREFNWSSHESNSAKYCQMDIQEVGNSFSVKVVINPSSTATNTPSGPSATCQIWGVS